MIILWVLGIWFAISFGLLGAWILLCIGVRMHEMNKLRRHVAYCQRRRDLQDLYRKDKDEIIPIPLEFDWDSNHVKFLAEERWGQLTHATFCRWRNGGPCNCGAIRTRSVPGR